jgi:PAS domain S-box-containing protein
MDQVTQKTKVLIVEDESVIASDIQHSLESMGYTVTGIEVKGENVLGSISKDMPDLVLMDIELQGSMDGVETARQIRTSFNIPVVYLTAFSDDRILERAKTTDPFGYMIKPFGNKEMHLTINMALYKHRADEELRKTGRALKTLSSCNNALVHATDEQELLREICRIIVEEGNYPLAWVGFAINDREKSIAPLAHFGNNNGFIDKLCLTWSDKGHELCPTGAAIRSGTPISIQHITPDEINGLWSIEAVKHGFASCIALPLVCGNNIIGALNIYSTEPNAFDLDEFDLLVDLANNLAYWILSLRNSKERKKAELALHESHERFTTVLDSLDALVYVSDIETHDVLFANRSVRDTFGDVLGKTCWMALQSGQEGPCSSCSNEILTDTPGGPSSIHISERRNLLVNKWYETHNRAIRWVDGRTVKMAIAVDITERKKTDEELKAHRERLAELVEERSAELQLEVAERKRAEGDVREKESVLRTLFEEALNPIMITNHSGRFINANRAALEFFDCDRDVLFTNDIWAFSTPEFNYLDKQDGLSLTRKRTFEMNYLIHGKTKTLLLNVVPFPLSGRKVVYCIGHDITERKKLEEELIKAHKLESVGLLAGGIAHDFNNILTAILTNISLAKVSLSSKGKTYRRLVAAENASLRAQSLTQQLLTFSMGGSPIKTTSSITEMLKETTHFALMGSNVRCEYHIPEDLWPVDIDEGQISQVINNLVINADQAMPEGGIVNIRSVNLHVGHNEVPPIKKGRFVKISIEDQGIGIPDKYMSRIFDPYFTTKQEGSGLGLASSYSIISKHDGHISVESEFGSGATFHIYLPASDKKPCHDTRTRDEFFAGRGRILIMDDDEGIRESMGEALAFFGYEVEYAEDGSRTLELYTDAFNNGNAFDVVIMDLTVPGGMGGAEAIKRLLAIDPKLKAIVSSGYFNDPILSRYREYGFSGVITKPYKVEELSRILHNVLMAEAK